jgi:Phycobilisome protein
MNPQIEAAFDDAENRYLKPDEIGLISQYTTSLPARLETYRSLRDHEMEIMQWVADQLQAEMPIEPVENLERSIKNGLLMLRCCAMAMLLNDESYVQNRFLVWATPMTTVYGSQMVDTTLYGLINHRLGQVLGGDRMNLLNPMLLYAQDALPSLTSQAVPEENGIAIGW